MSKMSTSGFDEFADELDAMADAVSGLDGKEISSKELFDDSGFVEKHTGYSTINDFLFQYGSDVSDSELFDESLETPFNQFIAKSTNNNFETFTAFHEAAADDYLEHLIP